MSANRPSRRTLLAGTLGAFAMTGCANSLGSTQSATVPRTEGIEQPELLVGALPIVGAAPLHLAAQEGLFQQAGLNVRLQQVASGAFAVPELLSGKLDITFSNYPSLIQNFARGGPARIIAEGSRAAPDNFAVVAESDSRLNEASDLAGKTVGVNAFDNVATLTTNAQLQTAGIRPEQVRYVQRGFPKMTDALLSGEVDAAFLPEPFLSAAEVQHGVKRLVDPTAGAAAQIPVDGYGALAPLIEKCPNTLRAFRSALREAQRRCQNPATLRTVLQRDLKIDERISAVLSPSRYPLSTDVTSLQRVATLMELFGNLQAPLDIGPMVIAA